MSFNRKLIKMKSKPILILIATLIIGFLLGMLASAQIRSHRLNPVRFFFSEERFREGFFRVIQPDDQQKAKIDLVLDKYAKINSELQHNFHKEFESSMNDFRKEVDTYLTKDQIARLRDMDERRQEMIRKRWKDHERDSSGFGDDRHRRHDGRSGYEDAPVMAPRPGINSGDSIGNK
jgi:hypothetical protein